GEGVAAEGLGGVAEDAIRADAGLQAGGGGDRRAEGGPGGGPGVRDQPGVGGDPVPPGRRVRRQADRLPLGRRPQEAAAGAREAGKRIHHRDTETTEQTEDGEERERMNSVPLRVSLSVLSVSLW